ncbi:M42 family metallopeptidase [Kyrpidia spormannii]|uniref:Fructose-lysine aminopeptidase n=2 Tax=Kyrpidia spormannii TaxID=2055160 RepID=A0ACA8Z6C4_9BACL|nr:M42 family metallopeptidase [Kyrpidia spormannii]CAB3390520.1 putative fructose-lysine aminopeptidase [Kyrpidia spormannii]CAB3391437.1 putative fructose-lysine aminopeptidase [Kyrpidia spormannii]
MDASLELLKELTEAPGAPGAEGPVRELMRKHLEGLTDEVLQDGLGSIVGKKVGDPAGPKVMVMGHMDEVAFLVTHITPEGFLRFETLGGWWEQVMLAQRVRVLGRKGEIIGVIGSKPPHVLPKEERDKVVRKKDMFIDIGAGSREEAMEFGVRPGDPVVPICPFTVMSGGKFIMAKAIDNRSGCAAVIDLLRQLRDNGHPNVVYAGATVQEEVGLRGAQTVAQWIQPDVFIAVDVGIAGDTPGLSEREALGKCGKGPLVLLYDATLVPNGPLRDLVIDTAEELGIPYQFDAMAGGGTDAGRAHLAGRGIPSIVIGFPTRYIHSHAALLHRDDYDQAVRLLTEVVRRLDRETVDRLTQ